MIDKRKIKIIKKSSTHEKPEPVARPRSKRVKAREMVSTVAGWVTEFKERKSGETRAAFDQLFSGGPQTNQS